MQVYAVKYVTGDYGGLTPVDAIVIGSEPTAGETIPKLYSIQDGTLKVRTSIPHGSAEQGDTWFAG